MRLLPTLCVLLLSPLALADVVLVHTGRLLDGNDAPVQSATLKFELFDAKLLGESKWSETWDVTPDAAGIYSVALGDTVGTGKKALPASVFEAGPVYLEISVGEVRLEPRLPIGTVPSAVNAGRAAIAEDALRLGGVDASDYALRSELSELGTYAKATDVYTKDETWSRDEAYSKDDTFSKDEVDAKLTALADATDTKLAGYVTRDGLATTLGDYASAESVTSLTTRVSQLEDSVSLDLAALADRLQKLEATVATTEVPHPPIVSGDGVLAQALTAVGATGNGGNLSYAGGDTAVLLSRQVTLPAFSRTGLDANATYHLRWSRVDGEWRWDLHKVPYEVPGTSATNPSETSRVYDSHPTSMLAARVTTGTGGTAPQILKLVNRLNLMQGTSDETARESYVTYGTWSPPHYERRTATYTRTLNWARTPWVMAAADGENSDDFHNQGTSVEDYDASRYRVSIRFVYRAENDGRAGLVPWLHALLIAP